MKPLQRVVTTLNFASVPAAVRAGLLVTDQTNPAAIPAGTTVVSKTGTTVTSRTPSPVRSPPRILTTRPRTVVVPL